MLPKVLLVCLIDLIAVKSALGWNHVSRSKFESIVSKKDLALVAFVAPWTEPSKALEAEWLEATSQRKTSLISIDCTIEADLCQEHEVVSYPAIRVFDGSGKTRRYKGPRKASAIVPYLNRATLPIVSTIDQKNITAFKSADEVVVIAYLPQEEKTLRSAFTELASRHHDKYTFGVVSDRSLAQAENIPPLSTVVYRPQEGEHEILSGPAGIDKLERFLGQATAPLIGEFTRRNELKYMKAGKSLVYYFAHTDMQRFTYCESLKPLAKKYKEYLNFVTVDAVEYGHMLETLGLKDDGAPALAVFNPMYGQTFPYEQRKKITNERVDSFVMDIVQGRVQPMGSGGVNGETSHTEL